MKIKQTIESWLGNSTWFITKLETLKQWIHKFLTRWEASILHKHANETIQAFDISDKDKEVIKVLASNYITYNSCNVQNTNGSSVPPKVLLSIILKTSKYLLEGIGQIISIQPIPGPVGLVYNFEYTKDDSGDSKEESRAILKVVASAVEVYTRKYQTSFNLETISQNNILDSGYQEALIEAIAQELCYEITDYITNKLFDIGSKSDIAFKHEDIPSFVGDKIQTLISHLENEGNEVAKETKRGKANWLIASPMVVTLLDAVDAFKPNTNINFNSCGPVFAGTLNDTIKVYSCLNNMFITGDRILMGYKGSSFDGNYIYVPYNLLMDIGGVVLDPNTYEPKVQLLNRQSEKIYNEKAFRSITVKDLQFI